MGAEGDIGGYAGDVDQGVDEVTHVQLFDKRSVLPLLERSPYISIQD